MLIRENKVLNTRSVKKKDWQKNSARHRRLGRSMEWDIAAGDAVIRELVDFGCAVDVCDIKSVLEESDGSL